MLLPKRKQTKFSIERFESIMASSGIGWKSINMELECDVESMLKNTKREPMLNVIKKACNIIGLANTDYVMMKSDTPKFNNDIEIDEYTAGCALIKSSHIDVDMMDLYIKESGWNYKSLSCIMSSKAVFKYKEYSKSVKFIKRGDLENLCWALNCKINDITDLNIAKTPNRDVNSKQQYELNPEKIIELADYMDIIAQYAKIPVWFIAPSTKVSSEMVENICAAITKVTKNNITPEELCINYKSPKKIKKTDSNVKLVDAENACDAIKYSVENKLLAIRNMDEEVDINTTVMLESGDYYYIRREVLISIINQYNDLNKIKHIISIQALSNQLVNMGIINTFKEGIRTSASCKIAKYGLRFMQFNKSKLNINTKGEEDMNTNNIVVTEETVGPVQKRQARYINNNQKRTTAIRDVLGFIDHASNDELDKLDEYIITIRKLRELKNSF